MNKVLQILIVHLFIQGSVYAQKADEVWDLIIVGGGASGISAGIQAARMGVNTIIIEKTPWIGGMFTSAGVSAVDGNHNLAGGIWKEFRTKIYEYYGGSEYVATGWVSHCLFEPKVGQEILNHMADLEHLTIEREAHFIDAKKENKTWHLTYRNKNGTLIDLQSKILIDASELAVVTRQLDVPYFSGMDDTKNEEPVTAQVSNNDFQDLTYTAILKDFGHKAKKIKKPKGYNVKNYLCACKSTDVYTTGKTDCDTMLDYARLPKKKILINWPTCGNDYFVPLKNYMDKGNDYVKDAKLATLGFLYYIQNYLGYKNLGIDDTQYDTKDGLPYIPYYRESFRIKGKVKLTSAIISDVSHPYWRTGIAVGDYPIDHHHKKNKSIPKLDLINIKIPAYTVPMGVMIPKDTRGFLAIEKNISVSNVVNGTSRLQPVVMGIGQAAGVVASIAIKTSKSIDRIDVREVQQKLIAEGAYIMPYIDVPPEDDDFQAIQRIGATGILKGVGVPFRWANQMWFYPEGYINEVDLFEGLGIYYKDRIVEIEPSGKLTSIDFLIKVLWHIDRTIQLEQLTAFVNEMSISKSAPLPRRAIARIIDYFLNPFTHFRVSIEGNILKTKNIGLEH